MRHWIYIIIIVGITAVIYLNSLNNGFVADDNEFVSNNTSIRRLKNIPSFFLKTETLATSIPEWGTHIYRPLRTTSYALDYAVFGLNSTGYHFTNITLHILVCISLYYLIMCLFQNPVVALLGAVLFAIHPVHVEAVSWIASRADLIGMLFFNLSLVCYITYSKRPDIKTYLYLSFLFSFLAYLGKESMIILPGIIILYDYISLKERSCKNKFNTNYFHWILFILISFCYLIVRFSVTGRMDQGMHWWGGSIYSNLLMMIKATAVYMLLLFFPFTLKVHYIIEPVTTILNIWVLMSLLIIMASFLIIVHSYKKDKKIFFLLIWFYIGLVPVANIIPMTFSIMAERFIYMSSAGPIIAMVYGLYAIGHSKKMKKSILYGIFISIFFIFSLRVVTRNNIYINELTFFTSAIESSPKSVPSYKGLADLYLKKKEYINAINNYEKAIELDPNYADAFMGESLALSEMNKKKEALNKANRAISIKPNNSSFRYKTGNIYKDIGDFATAITYWKKAVALNPNQFGAYNNLGNYYLMTENDNEAIIMYKEALRANPYNAETYYNIAIAYERQGNLSKAREHYLLFIKFAGDEYQEIVESVKKKYQ